MSILDATLMDVISRFADAEKWEDDQNHLSAEQHMKKQARDFVALAEVLASLKKEVQS